MTESDIAALLDQVDCGGIILIVIGASLSPRKHLSIHNFSALYINIFHKVAVYTYIHS